METGSSENEYELFVLMDDLFYVLKLLDYEKDFLTNNEHGYQSISRHYFSLQKPGGEQFFMFGSICVWLIKKCGKYVQPLSETDNTNDFMYSIVDVTRGLGFDKEIPMNRLQSGWGLECVSFLHFLATQALKASNFHWNRPIFPEEENEEQFVDNEGDESSNQSVDMDEEDEGLTLNALSALSYQNEDKFVPVQSLLESKTDKIQWELEVSRVLPHLRITVTSQEKDWRSRLEQMKICQETIEKTGPNLAAKLKNVRAEIEKSLTLIKSREKYLNDELGGYMSEYRERQNQLSLVRETQNQIDTNIQGSLDSLKKINSELGTVKQQMEERGNEMTDGLPLNRIKQATSNLEKSLRDTNVHTAVLENMLWHRMGYLHNNNLKI